MAVPPLALDPAKLLERFDRPVPRYTSYPPANHFHDGVGAVDYAAQLGALASGSALALYVHIPFCEKRCTYCGCHVLPTQKRDVTTPYLERLHAELRLLRARLGSTRGLAVVHLGGGTPTYLSPAELEETFGQIGHILGIEPGAEISVEVDPRVTTREHLAALRRAGASRLSLGVQDACDEVQEAIGRHQGWDVTRASYELARELGFESINIDLVYGLPHQTMARLTTTLERVIGLAPDRVAAFGYAHLPASRPHQRFIDEAALPSPLDRIGLCATLHEAFAAAGYVHIGLDHFARPEDPLAIAWREKGLARNFMGYTTWKDLVILGAGISAIADTVGGYFQNEKRLAPYYRAIDAGALPIERGYLLTEDDRARRAIIQDILCALEVDAAAHDRAAQERSSQPFWERYPREREELVALAAEGLLEVSDRGLSVLTPGRMVLRSIAAIFDRHLRERAPPASGYSRAI